ncbi:MAG: SDR family NAD(P)-dependent oxidoreductase, partial [Ignavibacteria bacterium]
MDYLKKLINLENKVAVLTGGGGILAGEMAKGLLNADVKIVLLDINESNLKNRVNSLCDDGKTIVGLKCNILDEENISEVKKEILDKFKHIDILINAAGGNMPGATVGVDQT